MAQLKALFEKQWESIVGNCDEFLYLGGNEQSTHKYVSELLGKSTIDTNTYGKSEGRSGSYSTNYQISGRELLTPDEVRMLDNRYAILFIRGERPVLDFKYDILKHPNLVAGPLVGQRIQILQKMNPEHQFQVIGFISALPLIVARSDKLLQLSPWHDAVDLLQKLSLVRFDLF